MSLCDVEDRVDRQTDDQRRPSEELIEGAPRNLRLHSRLFPGRRRAHLGPEVETTDVDRAAALREVLVSHLERIGAVRSPHIAAALRAVERHRFLPGYPLEEAYADRAIAIKTDGDRILSSISQPGMVAQMLELVSPRPGDHILEIGTGSGYNAALLAEMTGPSGRVTTVDLDAELSERARSVVVDEMGYSNVTLSVADGAAPAWDTASLEYDCVIVTARCDDIAAAWWDACRREGARLVAPLQLADAGEFAVGFVRHGDRLDSVGLHGCAFIELRGEAGAGDCSDIFYREPQQREWLASRRPIARVVAVRKEDGSTGLLAQADVVLARPVSLFALEFAAIKPV